VRFAPVRWPAPACLWLDLASGTLGGAVGDPSLLESLAQPAVEDVLYLPPVPGVLAAERDRLAMRHAGRGTPVLVQVQPGDPSPAIGEGVVVALDLLPLAIAALREEMDVAGAALPTADVALWPLAAGLGVAATAVLVPALAAAGVHALQGVRLDLSGRERRELGQDLGEERYLELFHGATPEPLAIARLAAAHGLAPLLERPLPRPPLRGAANLRAAGALAAAGELCLWLGEPESRAQSLLRAARFAERAAHDLAALARDGNLGVLPWLDGEEREVVAAAVEGSEPRLLRELHARVRTGG
jgi:hypothetical protein